MSLYTLPRILLLGLFTSVLFPLSAQVKGISYTVSPAANYTFWDKEAGLQDGLLVGGRLGFGFGEFIELRGNYLFDLGLKTNFDDFGLTQNTDNLAERDVKLTRYGGEIKLNLSRGTLLPFLTLGTGIQQLELDGGLGNEHIYASGGLGVVVSIADRFTFTVEGKNTAYNFNAVRNLLTEADRNAVGLDEDDFGNKRLSNWSLGAGLSLYLGGRRPGQLSAVDRAYENAIRGGFRGASLLVEPSVSHINFADELAYRDTWLGGAAVGLNFGPLVGFRLYYLQAMEDNKLNLNFDKLAMYGGDFRFRLSNQQTGLAPFLTLGGGYLDAGDDYVGRVTGEDPISQAFAAGGGGIALNLGRNFRITGSYKALLTTGRQVENLSSTDQIRTSGQWSAGINLAFGAKAKRPDAIFTYEAREMMERQRAEDALEAQIALDAMARRNAEAASRLRANYALRLDELRTELDSAYARQDSLTVDSLQRALTETEGVVNDLTTQEAELQQQLARSERDSTRAAAPRPERPVTGDARIATGVSPQTTVGPAPAAGQQGRLVFTPAEFEGLIEEIFEGLNYGLPAGPPTYARPGEEITIERTERITDDGAPAVDTARLVALENQLRDLQAAVQNLAERQDTVERAMATDKAALREEMRESTRQILEEIRKMREELPTPPVPSQRELRRRERNNGGEDRN